MKKILSLLLSAILLMSFFTALTAFAAHDEYISSPLWIVTANSNRQAGDYKNIIDGNIYTYWHSGYKAESGQIVSKDNPPFEITVTFPQNKNIAGTVYVPRQINAGDNSVAGIANEVSVYYSEDGKKFKHIRDDSYTYVNPSDRGEKTTLFDKVSAKAMKFVIKDGNGGFGTCAELKFIKSSPDDPDDNELTTVKVQTRYKATAENVSVKGEASRDSYKYSTSWKVSVSSAFGTQGAQNLFDRDKATYWHSWYFHNNGQIEDKDMPPYEVDIEFPFAKWVGGIRYLPRQDVNNSGRWGYVEIYGSNDGEKYTKLGSDSYSYKDAKDKEARKTTFDEALVKFVKVRVLSGEGNFATGAELEIIKGKSSGEDPGAEVERKEVVMLDTPKTYKATPITPKGSPESDTIPYSSDWLIESNSAMDGKNLAIFFDRDPNTRWHSWYRAEGSTVVEHSDAPYDVYITFPEEVTLKGVRYTPRPQGTTGIVDEAIVYGSSDGFRFAELGNTKFNYGQNYSDRSKQTVEFPDVTVKVICFRMTKTYGNNHGTGAELEMVKGDDGQAIHVEEYLKFNEKTGGKIELTIDSEVAYNDGREIKLIAPATIVDGRTLVPVRFVSESLGSKVTWDASEREVGIIGDGINVKLKIDSNRATVNNKVNLLDSPPRIINNSTMVPIRFISEALGSEVEWDNDTRKVTIKYKKSIGIWGDGLAASAGSITEPLTTGLYRLTGGINTYAYGGENESALTVAARQGAYDVVLAEDVTLASQGSTPIKICMADGREIVPRSGLGGWNECKIGSVTGTIAFYVDYTTSPRTLKEVRFIRKASSTEVKLEKGTKLEFDAAGKASNIAIFTIGNKALHRESPEELVAILKDMIDASSSKDSYIVLTPIEGTAEELKPYEDAYKAAFGERCIVTREAMLSEEYLKEVDVIPNEKNQADFDEGRIPIDLVRGKNDRAHLNDIGYVELSKIIYDKMVALGYIAK